MLNRIKRKERHTDGVGLFENGQMKKIRNKRKDRKGQTYRTKNKNKTHKLK